MKVKLIVSSLMALGVLSQSPLAFGAAKDLNSATAPADADYPKVGGNLGNQNYSGLTQINKHNLKKLEGVYAKHGTWILIVNRFIPGLRGAFMIGAGMARIPLVKVLIFGLISSILWNGVLIALGFLVSGSLPALINLFENYSLIVIGLIVAIIIYFVIRR